MLHSHVSREVRITPTGQLEKQADRKRLTRDYLASKWQGQELNLFLPKSKACIFSSYQRLPKQFLDIVGHCSLQSTF